MKLKQCSLFLLSLFVSSIIILFISIDVLAQTCDTSIAKLVSVQGSIQAQRAGQQE